MDKKQYSLDETYALGILDDPFYMKHATNALRERYAIISNMRQRASGTM